MNKIYVVPREGLKVPDPGSNDHLPAKGREVPDSPYWRRRLRDKEITVGAPVEASKPDKKKKGDDDK